MVDKNLISNQDNKIMSFIFIVPTLVLFGFAIYTAVSGPTTQELILSDYLNNNVVSRVDSLYFDKKNHNVKYALLTNGKVYPIFRNWEHYIEEGDSLSKKQGTFILEVYKKSNVKVTLDYRDIHLAASRSKQPSFGFSLLTF